jgi:hypothetical protein
MQQKGVTVKRGKLTFERILLINIEVENARSSKM